MPQYGPLVPGRSLGLGPGSLIDQGLHLLLIEHITASEVGFASGDALLSLRVGEQLQDRFHGLKILRGEQHDVLPAVAGDVNALVSAPDLVRSESRAFASDSGIVLIDQNLSPSASNLPAGGGRLDHVGRMDTALGACLPRHRCVGG